MLEGFILALLLNCYLGGISWKLLFSLLELESLIFALSIDVLKSFIFVLLLNGYVGGKNWKISSLLLELESLIFDPSMNMLKGFIFVLFLQVISEEKGGRVWLSYSWYLITPEAAGSRTVYIWKKLYCLIVLTKLGVLALVWRLRDVEAKIEHQGLKLRGQKIKRLKIKNDQFWSLNQEVLGHKATTQVKR